MRAFARCTALIATTLLVPVIGCRQEDESPTGPVFSPTPDFAASTLTYSGLTAGSGFSCGVTSDSRAHCWGDNFSGQLGDGTTTDRLTPVAVSGELRFRQLSAGLGSTCGVTTDHVAYCWGDNGFGGLGNGTTTPSLKPVAVAGGHKFTQVANYFAHACGVSYPDGRAWCWGSNRDGQLGNGTRDLLAHSTPIAVKGGLTFNRITTGSSHTCGVTTSNKVYCWGLNSDGQLGDGTGRRPAWAIAGAVTSSANWASGRPWIAGRRWR